MERCWTALPTYVVTFDLQDGSSVTTQNVTSGDYVIWPSDPSRAGYTFLGWNADYADAASFQEVFQGANADNTVGYASAQYDTHLATAMAATGIDRAVALQAAEAELLAADAIVPVYFLATRRLVRPVVKTGPPNLMNHNYTRFWRWTAHEAGNPPAP